jgi:8-oxo-dGTP pyrophosphatase MutT (NUDIX family)
MIRRKDTLGYVDFMRGRYNINQLYYINHLINDMTIQEKNKLLTNDFQTLWKQLWCINSTQNSQYKQEEKISNKKYIKLKETHTLEHLISTNKTSWDEPEWGFPKGRRNYLEKDLDCALREFEEETGINKKDIILINNIKPFEEIFIGSNFKSYKHKYFVAFYKNNNINIPTNFQKTEVSKINWFSFHECLHKIRSYNLEKKDILTKINYILNNYSIY